MEQVRTGKSVRLHYDQKLADLRAQLKDLGGICRRMLETIERVLAENTDISAYAFASAEREAAIRVRSIDRLCSLLILRQQPVSKDLRLITVATRVSTDLGRIAHLCLDLSKTLERISTDDFVRDLLNMCVLTEKQFAAAMRSVMELSENQDGDIERLDDQIDYLYGKIKTRLIRDNTESAQAVELLMAAKYLERIADHCVMIADDLKNPLSEKDR
ncbi:phosphate signaling complex PhoU family protein [Ileibacterium valens]|uniref:phosphate signaling complex PhoU family protein n=2 Tax=Ileibacterium valens TaxID=1862668 RepID=UPI00272BB308|nr:PhoU domain-containing protein [Ileibacterium valens]